ncbi:MAG: sulfate reduction electron transfer complex DsrMKJOP subunit DsrJ [Calditrichaeota bacterium]|jgi:hypothetical protein|nr:sulfate reduction electron transfer complex DsrMKJOP subunit DsrJ [Calditrichota bacterium]MBT7619177.1 sulfate reduction electron transfer complex DsrMKJOP subunit DsrJ [Calditrichota bacterium]MBT7788709.1 sulfate reduction electron transfer complex DsrMKJOP subunit DsrJ [Calditrichota bacterium]
MSDKRNIIIGVIIFILLMTIPIWLNLATGTSTERPELEKPKGDACVMDKEYMTSYHMDLLNEWREEVVRNGEREHIAPDGKKYDRSLTNTCLDCHPSKEKFCDQCHNYLGVKPYCWSCHIVPEEFK